MPAMSTAPYTPAPGSAEEIKRFHSLQEQLRASFVRFSRDPAQPYTAVVIPSQSFDPRELAKIPGVAHYEERSLFNLMLLRHPRLNVVYVTSKRLNPLIIDYYLHQMRGVPSEHARRRLKLLDCDDASARPLTAKILERPRLVQRVREAIQTGDMAHMVVFNCSSLERTLAVQLGIPINACDPELMALGSKTGSRRIFKEAGLQPAPGREGLRDTGDLVDALEELWRERPGMRRAVVKLDDSFSGEGNAILEIARDPALAAAAPGVAGSSAGARRAALREALPRLRFEAAGLTWPEYQAQFEIMGGVCEQWIDAPDDAGGLEKRSPSVQLRINPLREVQAVSTHDQVLGGPGGQVFMGASFPADRRYRLAIQREAMKAGRALARRGAIGRAAIDFLAVPKPASERAEEGAPPRPEEAPDFDLYAVEINLRQGGTTHPFNTLKFITDGRYDERSGLFFTAQGRERCYFATDTLQAPEYRGVLPFDLMDLLVVNGFHFRSDETGVVFHLLGCLSEFGKLGCTVIAPTVPGAKLLYAETVALLDRATGRAKG